MGKYFATTSGKGGVGKSSVSVGLAFAFAEMGKSVLLVDMDFGLRCLDLLLGVDESTVLDFSDLLSGSDIKDTAYKLPERDIYLITAPVKRIEPDPKIFSEIARSFGELFDVVIFDFPAGIDFSLYSRLPHKTLFLTVATPDPVSVRDASFVGDRLSEMSMRSRLIINRFDKKQSCRIPEKNIDRIIDTSGQRLLGIIPESREISLLSLDHSLNKRCRGAKAFNRIARRLFDIDTVLPKLNNI